LPLSLTKPALYAQDSTGQVVLLGGRCTCGYVFFPLQQFGCERCGRHGAALTPVALRGVGTLLATAMVHMHADKRRTAPFVIGTVALDDGPIVRTLLTESPPLVNQPVRVIATLLPVTTGEPATETLDLRFRPVLDGAR